MAGMVLRRLNRYNLNKIFLQGLGCRKKSQIPRVSGLQKGPAERGHVKNVKNRLKVSKSFSTVFDSFRAGQKNVKNHQKVSKSLSTLFDNFRAAPFLRPLLGASEKAPFIWGSKAHNVFNINFLAPLKTPHYGPPRQKFMCLISWERTPKRDPHKLFVSNTGSQTAIFGHKKLSLLFLFLAFTLAKTSLRRQAILCWRVT